VTRHVLLTQKTLGGKITPPGIFQIPDEIEAKFQQLPPFLVTAIPMEPTAILSDVTGCGKSKMASCKLQIRLSQFVNKIATKFQRLYLCFWDPAIQNKLDYYKQFLTCLIFYITCLLQIVFKPLQKFST